MELIILGVTTLPHLKLISSSRSVIATTWDRALTMVITPTGESLFHSINEPTRFRKPWSKCLFTELKESHINIISTRPKFGRPNKAWRHQDLTRHAPPTTRQWVITSRRLPQFGTHNFNFKFSLQDPTFSSILQSSIALRYVLSTS